MWGSDCKSTALFFSASPELFQPDALPTPDPSLINPDDRDAVDRFINTFGLGICQTVRSST